MSHTLWYTRPAGGFTEALPLGNGRMGAMVWGGTDEELIQLNESSFWSGYPRTWYNTRARASLDVVRDHLRHGRLRAAQELVDKTMLGQYTQSYLPAANLRIRWRGQVEVRQYRRELNLDEAVARSQFTSNRGAVTREVYISSPDECLVYAARGEYPLDVTVGLDAVFPSTVLAEGDSLELTTVAPAFVVPHYVESDNPIVFGTTPETSGMRLAVLVRVDAGEGTVTAGGGELRITGTRNFRLLVGVATSFAGRRRHPFTDGIDERALVRTRLAAALLRPAAVLRANHVRDHQSLYRRVELNLGSGRDLPTNERLARLAAGEADADLAALAFHFGRYLLIACSRPGGQPANLQGLWNQETRAYWSCNYTTNINVEMNYWPAEITNLAECHRPLLDYLADVAEAGSRVAEIHYGASGWVAHHNLDLWAAALPAGNNGGDGERAAQSHFWPMGGVWLCQHLWEHFAFGGDENDLRTYAFPLMLGAARFCLDWLVDDHGALVTMPSTSPENSYLTDDGDRIAIDTGSTCDLASIRELFQNCLKAESVLATKDPLIERIRRALPLLPGYRRGSQGELAEWSHDWAEPEPGHRHVSHLYGVYPGSTLSESVNGDYLPAASVTLQRRLAAGGGGTGWSLGWLVCLRARLGQGKEAGVLIRRWLTSSVYANLFDLHPPLSAKETNVFQIDGNFGVAAGVAEALVQSHNPWIELLPALPPGWPTGSVSGLRARGGLTVDLVWNEGSLAAATMTADRDTTVEVRWPGGRQTMTLAADKRTDVPLSGG